MYITTQDELASFIQRAQGSSVLAVDTEFMREKTYYPKLCLLQMGTAQENVIVDPFKVKDLTVLADLFTNPQVTKVFHAGRQDVEIIYHEVGVMPTPIFDTQIAAALLGYVQQIGYGALVQSECGVKLKKSDSFTDWSRRPLRASQLTYAADDVIYLPKVYQNMLAKLQELHRLDWLKEDFAELVNPKNYELDPRLRYIKLKRASTLSRRQLSAAREVAAWREEFAMKRNIPRKWFLSDEQIVEACRREARSLDSLFLVRGIREKLDMRSARQMVALIVEGLDAPQDTWPSLNGKSRSEKNVDIALEMMGALVHLRAQEEGIAAPTLAGHDDLVALARGHLDESQLMFGWRKELIGDELLRLLNGEIALSLRNGNLVVSSCLDHGVSK